MKKLISIIVVLAIHFAAYSQQKIGSEVFEKSPEIDVAKALYGQFAGLQVKQGHGTSSENECTLVYHGKAIQVFIDGLPRNINDITTAEIESATILSDAASCALYGVKGEGGVLLITTKRGALGPLKVTAKYELGVHTPYRTPEFADSYTYATKLNEALEFDGLSHRYNGMELDAFRSGEYPYYYPNVDWLKECYNKTALSHRAQMTFTGGQPNFKYYVVADYLKENSLYQYRNTDSRYNAKNYDNRLGLRGNIDVNITPTTVMRLGLKASLGQFNRANASGIDATIWSTPSAAFPVKNEAGIYGGTAVYGANNPVALLNDTGQHQNNMTKVLADLNLRQDLGMLVEGLSTDITIAFDYAGCMTDDSSKEYRYADYRAKIDNTGTLSLDPIVYGKDSQTLTYNSYFKSLLLRNTLDWHINYERAFTERQMFKANISYRQRSFTSNGRNTSSKTQEIYASVNWSLDNKLFIDAVANYAGVSYLEKGNRFNLYPAVNVSYKPIGNLRIFATAGLSATDNNLTHELYLSSYSSSNAGSYYFTRNISSYSGIAEGTLPAKGLKPEQSFKVSAGVDASFFKNRLKLYAEAYYEDVTHILVATNNISGVIGVDVASSDIGEQKYAGIDLSANYSEKIGDFTYGAYANLGVLTSKIVNDGQAFQPYSYLYHAGNKVGQYYGLEAIGYFECQYDIKNSPTQTFSDVRIGDIMYKDQNGDNVIDKYDVVPISGSNIPTINFGFGLNFGYKEFALYADFQGVADVTVSLLSSPLYQPLVDNATISKTFLDREITWTPQTATTATMPRLTTLSNANNYRASTLWMRDGSFLKLRNVGISYTVPRRWMKICDALIALEGTNLFSVDNIGFADPEQLGAYYPATRAFWAKVKFTF